MENIPVFKRVGINFLPWRDTWHLGAIFARAEFTVDGASATGHAIPPLQIPHQKDLLQLDFAIYPISRRQKPSPRYWKTRDRVFPVAPGRPGACCGSHPAAGIECHRISLPQGTGHPNTRRDLAGKSRKIQTDACGFGQKRSSVPAEPCSWPNCSTVLVSA